MSILFECLKLLFFLITIGIALLQITAQQFILQENRGYLVHVSMPTYLLICGLMIGYLISLGISGPTAENKVTIWGFIIGLVLGIGAALFYILGT